MRDSDIGLFSDMLSDIAALYGKTLSTTQIAMWFRLMAGFTVEQVQGAFDAHARDATTGRFMPLPADLLGRLQTMDGRPTPEEAWSTAIQAMDEAVTVVWTTETAQAWSDVGQALMDAGDKFNASRGFIAKYQEHVTNARKAGLEARWVVSQGHDKDLRHSALESAYKAGRISREMVVQMLPRHNQDAGPIAAAIAGKVVPLLSGTKAATPDRVAEIQRASDRLAKLAEQLRQESPADHRPSAEQGKRIVMQAIESGVLTSVREIDEWMTRAAGREDVSELQVRMTEGRRHA
jgi:ribosomal protein L13